MKKKSQVVLNLHGLSVPDKIEKTEKHVKAMTDNAHFPLVGDRLKKVGAAAEKLRTSYSEASDARTISATKTAIMYQDEDELDKELTALGHHVDEMAKGDEAKIKSAAMDVKATATPIGIPKRTEGLVVSEGDKSGSVELKWKGVRGSRSYVVQLTENIAVADSWKQVLVITRASATIERLASGTKYWFQVAAVGSAGQGPWSDPVAKTAP